MSRYARDPVSGSILPVAGGGSGGHTILDEDGITYPQRSKLQFEGCEITDDAVNGVTVVKCEGGVSWEQENILGAKNLCPNTAVSKTENGVTFTVNSDGSITFVGTSTSYMEFAICVTPFVLKKGSYIFSGIDTDYETQRCALAIDYTDNTSTFCTNSEGTTFTLSEDKTVRLVRLGANADAATIVYNNHCYPMIRLASITDSTYVPYALTNKALTDKIGNTDISSVGSTVTGAISNLTPYFNWFGYNGSGNKTMTLLRAGYYYVYIHGSGDNGSTTMTLEIQIDGKRAVYATGTQGGVIASAMHIIYAKANSQLKFIFSNNGGSLQEVTDPNTMAWVQGGFIYLGSSH